jgi:acyl phosphate:glycerol-3-phosphate acyltransferase
LGFRPDGRRRGALAYAVAAIVGYLVGSIPIALMVGRAHGVDLREVGDRNPGAWNALEQLGPRTATPVFLGDGLKGFAGGGIGWLIAGVPGAYAGVAGAMLGHAFPVFAGFRGGKSVMTFGGGTFALSPPAAALALAVCGAVTVATSFKWGARAGIFAFPLIQLAFAPPGRVAATGGLMAIIGLRFAADRLRRRDRSAPATSARGAPPTT